MLPRYNSVQYKYSHNTNRIVLRSVVMLGIWWSTLLRLLQYCEPPGSDAADTIYRSSLTSLLEATALHEMEEAAILEPLEGVVEWN